MSADNAVAGMPDTIQPKEVLWGRQGFGPDFFGPDLIAEAISEVLKTSELSRLRGFTRFPVAFQKHHLSTDWKVGEGERVSTLLDAEHPFNPNLTEFCGTGSYDENFGLVPRNPRTAMPPLGDVVDWVTREAWSVVTHENDRFRVADQKRMPDLQVSHIRNKRLFMSRSGNLTILRVQWEARSLQPSLYSPIIFEPLSVDLIEIYRLDQDGIRGFCNVEGAQAGAAFLRGLKLILQSSNYQVREELEKNAQAEEMAKRLLERIEI